MSADSKIGHIEHVLGVICEVISKANPAITEQLKTYFEHQNSFHTRDYTNWPNTQEYRDFVVLAERLGVKVRSK